MMHWTPEPLQEHPLPGDRVTIESTCSCGIRLRSLTITVTEEAQTFSVPRSHFYCMPGAVTYTWYRPVPEIPAHP